MSGATVETVDVALIGYGLSGETFQAPLIRATPGLRLASVTSASAAAATSGLSVRTYEDVLADPAIGLVVLATPTAAHYEGARRALLAGKHLVVEKPLAVTGREADDLVALAADRGVLLTVFHNRRWDADFLTLKALLRDGALGEPVRLEANWNRFRPQVRDRWRERDWPGSGVWYDLGAHLVDQVLQLFGPPRAVSAEMGMERRGASAPDWFEVQLHYPSGFRAVLRASSMALAPSPRFLVQGRDAAWVKMGLDPQEDLLKAAEITPGAPGWGEDAAPGLLIRPDGDARTPSLPGDYPAFYPAVRDAILGCARPPVAAEEAALVVRLLELATRSAVEGRRLDL